MSTEPEECFWNWGCDVFFQPPLSFCDTVVPRLGGPGNDFHSVKIDLEH